MNKLLLLLIFFSCNTKAQYTLTSAFNSYTVGDVQTVQSVDSSLFTVLPGGNNVVWNYSSITPTYTRMVNYISPAATPSASYPGATVVKTYTNSLGPLYEYYKVTPTTSEYMGICGTNTNVSVVNYTNTAVFMQFPFSYPQSNSDLAAGNHSVPTCCNPNTNCNVWLIADGTGTLILPASMSNPVNINCVRIKTETQEQITLPVGYFTDHIIIYDWYNSTSKFPLMSIYSYTRTTTGPFPPPPTSYISVAVDPNVVMGVNQAENNSALIQVFPIPASDMIMIRLFEKHKEVKISLQNDLGQTIKSFDDLNSWESFKTLDVKDIPSGVYFLRIENENTIETKKIVLD